MGAQGSSGVPAEREANELAEKLDKACNDNDLESFKKLWEVSNFHRLRRRDEHLARSAVAGQGGANDFGMDLQLLGREGNSGVVRHIKYALRHMSADWREEGIRAAASFLHLEEGRKMLAKIDFTAAIPLLTMEDDHGGDRGEDEEDEEEEEPVARRKARDPKELEQARKHAERTKLAADVLYEMSGHKLFADKMCDIAILNFLGVSLNQVPECAESVTGAFDRLSGQQHLFRLSEASVGDVLESYIKTVHCGRPPAGYSMVNWKRDVRALGNCASTLGTFFKHGYHLQVETETVIKVFDTAGVPQVAEDAADNLRLLAEIARLFYWMCRMSETGITDRLYEKAQYRVADPHYVMQVLADMWRKCLRIWRMIEVPEAEQKQNEKVDEKFLTDDLDKSVRIERGSPEAIEKEASARKLICHMCCLLWLCLPVEKLRWKMLDLKVADLSLAFELSEPELRIVALSTARHLLDLPEAQQCHDLIEFFCRELLILIDAYIDEQSGQTEAKKCARVAVTDDQIRLVVDCLSILAMQRGMQAKLAAQGLYNKFKRVELKAKENSPQELDRMRLMSLFVLCEVSVHPTGRLGWMRTRLEEQRQKNDPSVTAVDLHKDADFRKDLQGYKKDKKGSKFVTIASLLLLVFGEQEHEGKLETGNLEALFKWWQLNTTAKYEERRKASPGANADDPEQRTPLKDLIRLAIQRREENATLRSVPTMKLCSPHECVLLLSLFSRFALEPKFKNFFFEHVEQLLGCVCAGIWAEAREAAATLANLMWLPDRSEENLVCWLKFDAGLSGVAIDSANVLMPVHRGEPVAVDIGKGMYKSTWGIEFVKGSYVQLHKDGLWQGLIPALLTSASPSDDFRTTSADHYKYMVAPGLKENSTITCWYYWPEDKSKMPSERVLLETDSGERVASIKYDREQQRGLWCLMDKQGSVYQFEIPKLQAGWHHVAIVVSKKEKSEPHHDGTKLYLDGKDYHSQSTGCGPMAKRCLKDGLFIVGNTKAGDCPFGLIADFRIYATALAETKITAMSTEEEVRGDHRTGFRSHPDSIVRELAKRDAVRILALRLDVPDCAAECLRALGSLASYSPSRAHIFGVCGMEALRLLHSPHSMIKRLAARLLTNMA